LTVSMTGADEVTVTKDVLIVDTSMIHPLFLLQPKVLSMKATM